MTRENDFHLRPSASSADSFCVLSAGTIFVNDSTSGALLRYLCEHPDDVSARLVFADHLEDQGRPERAELIRVQVGLTCGRDPTAAARETELLTLHGDRWREEVPAWARRGSNFRRGFVAEVRCTVVDWLAGGEDLVARTPIEEVFFEPGPTDAAALANSVALARVRSLILCNAGLGDRGLRDFLASPYLSGLRELFLAGNDLGNEGIAWIARSSDLNQLAELDLRDNHIGDPGVRRLAASPYLTQLSTLYLVNNRIGDEGTRWLAEGSWANLTHLYLNHNQIGDEGVRALVASSGLARLTELDLRNNRITNEGARLLAAWPALVNLRELLLLGNPIGTAGWFGLRRHFGGRVRI
jgi:uncharacterized protein (TIGR02996 family)